MMTLTLSKAKGERWQLDDVDGEESLVRGGCKAGRGNSDYDEAEAR